MVMGRIELINLVASQRRTTNQWSHQICLTQFVVGPWGGHTNGTMTSNWLLRSQLSLIPNWLFWVASGNSSCITIRDTRIHCQAPFHGKWFWLLFLKNSPLFFLLVLRNVLTISGWSVWIHCPKQLAYCLLISFYWIWPTIILFHPTWPTCP